MSTTQKKHCPTSGCAAAGGDVTVGPVDSAAGPDDAGLGVLVSVRGFLFAST